MANESGGDLLPLNIDVHWSSGRVVHVHVDIQPFITDLVETEGVDRVALAIDDAVLATPASLRAALADATRASASGAEIDAVCFDVYLGRLYKALSIEPPAPDPVVIRLPPDA